MRRGGLSERECAAGADGLGVGGAWHRNVPQAQNVLGVVACGTGMCRRRERAWGRWCVAQECAAGAERLGCGGVWHRNVPQARKECAADADGFGFGGVLERECAAGATGLLVRWCSWKAMCRRRNGVLGSMAGSNGSVPQASQGFWCGGVPERPCAAGTTGAGLGGGCERQGRGG